MRTGFTTLNLGHTTALYTHTRDSREYLTNISPLCICLHC